MDAPFKDGPLATAYPLCKYAASTPSEHIFSTAEGFVKDISCSYQAPDAHATHTFLGGLCHPTKKKNSRIPKFLLSPPQATKQISHAVTIAIFSVFEHTKSLPAHLSTC